ncbi:hypothetical protein IMSAGC019_01326 [Lachnospiraceae bacterium]|nr:hypothetical protein IMSAGC019_01326 [Lachnospiraceae bacterium]
MDREQTGFKVLGTYAAGGMGLGTGKSRVVLAVKGGMDDKKGIFTGTAAGIKRQDRKQGSG